MKVYTQPLTIKSWAEEDRPREKLLLHGKQTLSDAELIAILIGSGTKRESAVDLAKRILAGVKYDLHELGKLSIKELTKFRGIGEAKAITVVAALELGRRRQAAGIKKKVQIKDSRDIYHLLRTALSDLPYEEFWAIYLNRANKVITRERISAGGVSGTVADVKIIFKSALMHLASSVIVCHNHPSGSLQPSKMDMAITKKLKESGKLLEISLLDHLIIADTGYYSFADEGML